MSPKMWPPSSTVRTMVEMGAVANATGLAPDVPGMHGPEETVPDRLPDVFALREDGGVLTDYGVVDYVRGVAPGVFVIVRSPEGPVRETLGTWDRGPDQTTSCTGHTISRASRPRSPWRAPPSTVSLQSSVLPCQHLRSWPWRSALKAGDRLGSIGSADYYGWLYEASEAKGMLPLGIAAGARITQAVARGQAVPRSGVESAENSFAASLRRLQIPLEHGPVRNVTRENRGSP